MLTPILAVIGNVVSAVALILTNKRIVVVENFRFMSLLTGLHFYFSFIVCCGLLLMGTFQYKAVSNYASLFKICLGSLASIVFMNLNLMTNSVGFYQLSKLSCIPITLIIETLLNRRQQLLTFSMLLSLSFIMGGMSFIVINELSLSGFGLIWATLAVVATSLAQVLFGPLQKELGMNSIQLLFHTSPVLTVGSYFLIPLFEDTTKLLNTDITGSLVAHILASSIMAVMLNITNYFVLSITSPLTYQILNHCKTIMVILSGILFFDEYPSTRVTIGMSLVIVGVIIYSEENRQQQLRRQDKNSILPEVMNTTESKPSKQEDNSLPQLKARNSDINLPSNQTPFVQDRLVHSQYSANISNNMSSSDTKYVTTVGSVSPPILSRHNSNSSNFDYSGDINRKATVYVTSSTDAQSG